MLRKIAIILVMLTLINSLSFSAYAAEENPAPNVLPAVREWHGGSGKFYVTENTKIVLESEGLLGEGKKDIISAYFAEICSVSPKFVIGTPSSGDIFLSASAEKSLGTEGYREIVADTVTVKANGEIGFLYGIITLLQSVMADGFMPKGEIFDVPEYEIRSGMIDVARAYVPMDYLTEITKYFAWFKLNEIHIHINDRGSDGKGYFRLESDVEGLTSEQHYTKDEYRNYQKQMAEFGINVVTEIDTPAHSSCFASAVPQYMFDSVHIDITNPEAVEFVCSLWDEYITGDDPVFVGKTVHFGTDEFCEGYNEEMRKYTDTLIKHIRSRGYVPRFWGSFGGNGFNGSTEVSSDAECNFWAVSLSDYKVLFDMGYDIINTCGPVLYCVPGGNYGFADYYNLELLYSSWQVNYMGISSETAVDPSNKQLKGACFALWNDLWGSKLGFSVFDIFDRLRYQVALISEKTWCGAQTADIGADDFMRRFAVFSDKAPLTNPGRYVQLPINETNSEGISSVGYPYLFDAEISINSLSSDILSGNDGRLYIDSSGKIGYARESYTFLFNTALKSESEHRISLYCDNRTTLLIIDGRYYYDPINTLNSEQTMSSTFVLPLENIGSDGVEVKSFSVKAPDFTPNGLLSVSNVALGKNVTVSGLEVDYAFNESLAVDGDMNTRLSFARDKDVQWLVVDLGDVYKINKVTINFFERVSDYEIYTSLDGESYEKAAEVHGKEEGVRGEQDDVAFDTVSARYVKYVQLKRWFCEPYNTYYSGGITEFAVYTAPETDPSLIEKASSCDDAAVKKALTEIKKYESSERIYAPHLASLYADLADALSASERPVESEDVPASPEAEAKGNGSSKKALALTIAALAAATAVALIIIKKKKKK